MLFPVHFVSSSPLRTDKDPATTSLISLVFRRADGAGKTSLLCDDRYGQDGYSSSAIPFDSDIGIDKKRSLRVGWLVEPGFGPIDREVAATVKAAAEALKNFGHTVASVRIRALERDFALDVFSRLHVLEMKPGFVKTTAGSSEDEIGAMARFMLSLPDTPAVDHIDAVQAAERLKDGYAAYFQKYDVLLTPVLPLPSFKHGQKELLIDG
jgi:aspartyl-tRNA(Asn)/glutamyl-tRNA(Gln) amidotransferase subunit A